MKRVLLALLLVPLAAATVAPEGPPDMPYWIEHDGLYLGFDINATHVSVDTGAFDGSNLDVVVLLGTPGAPEPDAWYVLHFGNRTLAVDADGAVLDVVRDGTTATVARSDAGATDCFVVAAQVWDRVDDEKQVWGAFPPLPDDPWQAGAACHAQQTLAEHTQSEDSPAPWWLVGTALAAALVLRRR